MDDLTARDIMQAEVITVTPETTVRELADLLAEKKVSGVPVIDGERHVVGIVTEGDVILQDADLHFPHYIQFLDGTIYLESVRKFEERFRKAFGAKVADVMSTEVLTVEPGATVHEMATLMADNNVNRLPVVEDGVLVGIVTRADVVRAIADLQT
ncbi:MAG: CBS domain-containing protein [Thermoleophilia bacterium]|nr:CBS domain-containing protein [Thermoleophilia bacterium]